MCCEGSVCAVKVLYVLLSEILFHFTIVLQVLVQKR